MVMRLAQPATLDSDLIEQVVIERQAGGNAAYFTGIKPLWLSRIQDFRLHGGNPQFVPIWPGIDIHKTKFLTLYKSPKDDSVQKPILEALRSRKLQLCPACGEDGQPNTLDHYLPKDLYPEFAITPINLFPMCDICQGAKLAKTLNINNERLFLQPYFDDFLSAQAVELSIGRPFHAPRWINLLPHHQLTVQEGALVGRHLAGLNYALRYMRFFSDEHPRLLKLVNRSRESGQNVIQNLQNFRDNAKDKSINSWGHIFYDGVLKNASFVRYLEIGKLPSYI
jgi:hypothetical protein